MKVTKIDGLGSYGHYIDDVVFLNMPVEQAREILKIHLSGLVTVFRNVNLPLSNYRQWIGLIGAVKFNNELNFIKKYNVSSSQQLLSLFQQGKLERSDMLMFGSRGLAVEKTATGDVYRVSGERNADGELIGTFGVGDVDWHSNEAGQLNFTPGVSLLGYRSMQQSATSFAQTADYYQQLSQSTQSEFDQMVVVYKYQRGQLNQLEHEDEKFALRVQNNMCPVDGSEVPLVVTSPGGIRGIHYPKHNMWKIKGMSEQESQKIFHTIEENVFAQSNVYDHWYQQDNDLLLFDNSITAHRRIGSMQKRLAYRLQFEYKFTPDWCPFHQQEYADQWHATRQLLEDLNNQAVRAK